MRAKFVNEKFKEQTDPIDDMKIGQITCPECDGDGWYPDHDPLSIDSEGYHDCSRCPIQVQCEKCGGTGYISKKDYDDYFKLIK